MQYDVYADVMFLTNFTADALALALVRLFMKRRARTGRVLAAAAFGALYATVFFFLDAPLYVSAPLGAVSLFLIILIAFGFGSVKKLVSRAVIFALALAGFAAATAVLALFTPLGGKIIFAGGFYYFDLSFFTVLISSLLSTALCFFVNLKKRPEAEKGAVYGAAVTVFGKTVKCRALMDTGNSLFDGIYGVPIIVCEYKTLKDALPSDLREEKIFADPTSPPPLPPEAAKKLRVVFVSTVSGTKPMFCASVDILELEGVGVIKRETAVAVSAEPLGKYPMLLNPMIFD